MAGREGFEPTSVNALVLQASPATRIRLRPVTILDFRFWIVVCSPLLPTGFELVAHRGVEPLLRG